jgi:hypothetical protein
MNFCQGCGKLLSTGQVVQDPKDALAFTLQGISFEPHILQPMKDGCLITCLGCHTANRIATLCSTTAKWQALPLATLPAAAPETKPQWRLRMAQRLGMAAQNLDLTWSIDPALVAQFNQMGI